MLHFRSVTYYFHIHLNVIYEREGALPGLIMIVELKHNIMKRLVVVNVAVHASFVSGPVCLELYVHTYMCIYIHINRWICRYVNSYEFIYYYFFIIYET